MSRKDEVAKEIFEGLISDPPQLPSKLLYDKYGSELFEQITELPSYYVTRAEIAALTDYAEELAGLMGRGVQLIEYGAGDGRKVDLLLSKMQQVHSYIPVDISCEQLEPMARQKAERFGVTVVPICADFTSPLYTRLLKETLSMSEPTRRVAFFPGSTLGNFMPDATVQFLRNVRLAVGQDGGMVLGVDMPKDPLELWGAYNDPLGITAAFNKNILAHVNRLVGSNFSHFNWQHVAFWNDTESRVEMWLECTKDQVVSSSYPGWSWVLSFAAGQRIRTEVSYKYRITDLNFLAARSGWVVKGIKTNAKQQVMVAWMEVK